MYLCNMLDCFSLSFFDSCCCIYITFFYFFFFFFKQKTAYEMRISDWSSDVCSSDLLFTFLTCKTLMAGPFIRRCAADGSASGLCPPPTGRGTDEPAVQAPRSRRRA